VNVSPVEMKVAVGILVAAPKVATLPAAVIQAEVAVIPAVADTQVAAAVFPEVVAGSPVVVSLVDAVAGVIRAVQGPVANK
jgi:type III secretory pathway component EscU